MHSSEIEQSLSILARRVSSISEVHAIFILGLCFVGKKSVRRIVLRTDIGWFATTGG